MELPFFHQPVDLFMIFSCQITINFCILWDRCVEIQLKIICGTRVWKMLASRSSMISRHCSYSTMCSYHVFVNLVLTIHNICPMAYQWGHYNDVIMGVIASEITSLTIVYSIVYSDADQRKHQSSVSLAFVRGIHRGPVNTPHKWPVTRKIHLMMSSCQDLGCLCEDKIYNRT